MTKENGFFCLIRIFMKLYRFLLEIFYILSASLLCFGMLEIAWPRVVLAHLNLSAVLLIWLIIGIFITVINKKAELFV
jgi:hypothetical protein